MAANEKPKVDLAALAEEFTLKPAPDAEADAKRAQEQSDKDGKSTKRTNRMKAFVMGNIGNSGGN